MDDARNRLLLLVLAGVLLVGGSLLWVNSHKHEEEAVPQAKTATAGSGQTGPLNLPKGIPFLPSEKIEAMVNKTAAAGNEHAHQIDQMAEEGTLPPGAVKSKKPSMPSLSAKKTGPSIADKQLPDKSAVTSADAPPPTTRGRAAVDARAEVGRSDPYEPVTGYKPYPRNQPVEVPDNKVSAPKTDMVPPPPPSTASLISAKAEKAEKPPAAPPAKFDLGEDLQLVAVIGSRAVLAFRNPQIASQNRWPQSLSLGSGERFGPVVIVQISPDSVVLDEEGRRLVKALKPIR